MKTKVPVTFLDFANQNLILSRLFTEGRLPSRQKLGLSLAQYKILRIQHFRHLREQLLSRISGYSEIKQVLHEVGV